MGDSRLPRDCGPHCKLRVSDPMVGTYKIVHCKKKNCKLCHNKPRPTK